MSEQPRSRFQNILLTLKKYQDSTFELLYISSEIREIINGDTKFYKEHFFEKIFPTLKRPIFDYLFKALGNGDKFICPIILKENHFLWVEIEGYVISQEDGSYLINALISPLQTASSIKYAWIVEGTNHYPILQESSESRTFENWQQLIKSKFSFVDKKALQNFGKKSDNSFITIFPNRLYLTKKTLQGDISLIQLEYHTSQSAVEKQLVENISNNQNGNLVYYELDRKKNELSISGAIKNVLGYDPSYFVDFSIKDWEELIHLDDRVVFQKGFEHSNTIIYKFLHADGNYIFLQDEIRNFNGDDLNSDIILGVIGDISELKEIEKELIDNKTILDELTGVVPGIVYMLKSFPDGTHQYIFVSEGSKELAEIEPRDIIQDEKTFENLILSEDLESVLAADRNAYTKNQKFSCEFRIKTTSGKEKWVYGASNRLKKYQKESIWAGIFIDITESKIKEKESRLNLLKYKSLFDENPLAIFHFDQTGKIIAANKQFILSLGVQEENQIIGKNLFDLVDNHPISNTYQSTINEGSGYYEGPYISYFSKQLFHIRVRAKAIGDNSFEAIIEDINEQEYVHNVLAELTERTSKFSGQEFFDALTLFLSEKMGMEYCFISEVEENNEKASAISIFKNGKKLKNFRYDIANSPCEKCLRSNSPLIILQDVQKQFPLDEDLVKMDISAYMGVSILDINDNKLGMLVLMNTKQIQVSTAYSAVLNVLADRIGAELSRLSYEKRLLSSEQLFRSIAENFPKGTIEVLDRNLMYVYTDGKEYRQQDIDPSYLIGTSLIAKYTPKIANEVNLQLKKVLKGEQVMFELVIGDQYYLKSGVPLVNNQGEIDRILLVTQNITESKNAEEERNLLIKDLKSQNEELQRFAYIISHNLRAPIVNITSLLELYNSLDPADNENIEIIDNLRISTRILNHTLQDLIDVVAIKKNKLPKIEKVDFETISGNIEKSLSKQLKEAKTKISKDFTKKSYINYVYSHLENFLINLTTNAIKYKHPKRNLNISIKTYEEGHFTVIEFKDNGIGIDLERYGDRLFGLYQRFHSHVEGKGLGLYLVREQIRAHDGNLHVESEVGKGTTFYIYLKNLIGNT
ncbi:PAS domain S-box [Belliella baltica DSM 15883]|uniref:histidine kinase n=1 Tax=Belliella baltica (strain DSM 15883 / CIP 108006 / LMG 21964 / BA134) TaxID=866536 RepID=I3Z318_BELBD|nr:PAS domain S-box protein [Belliella baltica]AFL83636.1 PAS domain S-box [Belliella baltica DSM 15883]